jgi:hypothetical protein
MGCHLPPPPPPLDIDVVKLEEVSLVSRVGESRRMPARLRSPLCWRRAVVDSNSIERALDYEVRGGDGLLEPRVRGRVRRRRLVNGGPSLLLLSMLAALLISALRDECLRSHVELAKGTVSADVSQAAIEMWSCSTKELSTTVGLVPFRLRLSISCGYCS